MKKNSKRKKLTACKQGEEKLGGGGIPIIEILTGVGENTTIMKKKKYCKKEHSKAKKDLLGKKGVLTGAFRRAGS